MSVLSQYEDQLISPKQFVHISGKATLKDWKRAIRMGGVMLRSEASTALPFLLPLSKTHHCLNDVFFVPCFGVTKTTFSTKSLLCVVHNASKGNIACFSAP